MAGGLETPKMYQCLRGFVFYSIFDFPFQIFTPEINPDKIIRGNLHESTPIKTKEVRFFQTKNNLNSIVLSQIPNQLEGKNGKTV